MDGKMSQHTKQELLAKMRRSYENAGRDYRGKLIDQAVELCGYHRKAAIRALGGRSSKKMSEQGPAIIGRPRLYEAERIVPVLKVIWLKAQQPCGKRLVGMLPDWLPAYAAYFKRVPNAVEEQLLAASSATLDRLLRPLRAQYKRPALGTKPGTMLRQSIPIRGGSWQEDEPGWTEADTVAFCGGSAQGEVVWMLDNVDICTDWVELRAMFGRGQHATLEQLKDIEASLPFAWLGLDSDNGGEFINRHVLQWCQRGRAQPIYYTRSRPYRSNDNAHVEQKNWTHVRQWFGYERHDNSEVVPLMNELARGPLGQFLNLFNATLKLDRKEKSAEEGLSRRIYAEAQTPYARVQTNPRIKLEEKKRLRALKESLNPFALEARIQKALGQIHKQRRAAA